MSAGLIFFAEPNFCFLILVTLIPFALNVTFTIDSDTARSSPLTSFPFLSLPSQIKE